MKEAEDKIGEAVTFAMVNCIETGKPQQIDMTLNKGKFIVLIVKIEDKHFLPEMRNPATMPEMQGPL